MSSAPAPPHTPLEDAPRSGRFVLVAAIVTVLATAANLGLYAVARASDAALSLDPGAGEPGHLVTAFDVAWKTALPLAAGALVLGLVALRSRRWTTVVTVVGAAIPLISIPFVFTGAHDTLTAVLLSGMHTVSALAYIAIGARARRNSPA